MHTYSDITETIISMMRTDHPGFLLNQQKGDDDYFRKEVLQLSENTKNHRNQFKNSVANYLADFNDAHTCLIDETDYTKENSLDFSVRRYDDALYVYDTNDDSSFLKMDKVTALDNRSIKELSQHYRKQLGLQIPERQLWEGIISQHKMATIERNGMSMTLPITPVPRIKKESIYTIESVDEETTRLTLSDFMDKEQLDRCLEDNSSLLEVSKLIIDLRYCGGGSDATYQTLLPYLYPPNYTTNYYYSVLMNATERNVKNRLLWFENNFAHTLDNPMVRDYMTYLQENIGKGFVPLSDSSNPLSINGYTKPESVIILIDRYLRSSGDMFALVASKSPKVTLVGRNTYGMIDCSNTARQELGLSFSLQYSTTISQNAINGECYDGIGIAPDIYIPWTPEEILTDKLLDVALQL